MLTALDSIVVEVEDLAAASRDFGQLLGRAPRMGAGDARRTAGGPGTARATFSLSNVRLELRAPVARAADPGSDAAPVRAGGGIVAIRLRLAPGAEVDRTIGPIASPTVPIELVTAGPETAPIARAGLESEGLDAPARITGLDHVVIVSADPERTGRFFGESLGIRLALDRRFPERGLRLMFFRLGGVTIEVASALPEPPDAPAPRVATDVFQGLAWRVEGLDRVHARLARAGFTLSPIRPGHKPGTRVCTVQAPLHGVPTLLIEHPVRPTGEP